MSTSSENPHDHTSERPAAADEYVEAVRRELADLPATVRDELLDDLTEHLTEITADVAAEAGTSAEGLRARLGEPADYAAELRAVIGYAQPSTSVGVGLQQRAAAAVRRAAAATSRADRGVGRLLGYPRLRELLLALRPAWWVARGWVAAQFLGGVHSRQTWRGFVPVVANNRVVGAVCLLALVVLSVWLGRRTSGATEWPRRIMAAASALAAAGAVAILTWGGGGANYVYIDSAAGSYYDGGSGVSDLYVYDGNGNPVPQARLFDQDGNPAQLGDPTCRNGEPAPGVGLPGDPYAQSTFADGSDYAGEPADQVWTYPLCPDDPGPFRSGPGALSGAAPSPSAPASIATPTAPTTSTTTATPSGRATPPATPQRHAH